MALESASWVSQLDPLLPAGSGANSSKSEGDDVLRLIKAVLVASFPNISGAVTATHSQLNTVTAKADRAGDTYSGTHNYTAATVQMGDVSVTVRLTVPSPSLSTDAASKGYVDSFAFNQALPAVTADDRGKAVVNDGTTIFWGTPSLTAASLYFAGI